MNNNTLPQRKTRGRLEVEEAKIIKVNMDEEEQNVEQSGTYRYSNINTFCRPQL